MTARDCRSSISRRKFSVAPCCSARQSPLPTSGHLGRRRRRKRGGVGAARLRGGERGGGRWNGQVSGDQPLAALSSACLSALQTGLNMLEGDWGAKGLL